MKRTGAGPWPVVTTDGTGVVSHAGTALLRELAERVGLRAGLSEVETITATDGHPFWVDGDGEQFGPPG